MSQSSDPTAIATEPRLPRGRHGLSPEQVAHAQRLRMFAALADSLHVKGYAATSVSDIIRGAGVSRETFYQQFASKAECFAAAFGHARSILLDTVTRSALSGGDRMARFERVIHAYLEALASHPALARLCLVEVYAAGPEMVQQRFAIQEQFAQDLAELMQVTDALGRFGCEVVVAAVGSMVVSNLVTDDLDGIRALEQPLIQLMRAALQPPRRCRPW